jgi:hypothetical protein
MHLQFGSHFVRNTAGASLGMCDLLQKEDIGVSNARSGAKLSNDFR